MTRKMTAAELQAEVNGILGAGTLRMASDPDFVVRYVSTGVLPIDVILGGGLPRNRITELFGDYSTLKSFIGLRAIATTQAMGGTAALVDTEHSFDPEWATALGVDTSKLILEQPETGEEAVDKTEVLIRNGIDLIVWDSVAATLPQDEAKKRLGKKNIQPARLAALMSVMMRRLTAANSQTAMLFINQTRLNVGQMFGDPTVTPGGKALPFYASLRVRLRKAGAVKVESKRYAPSDKPGKISQVTVKKTVGQLVKATVEKSKLDKPHAETTLLFDLNTGTVDEVAFLIAYGLENRWIKVSGQSYTVLSYKPVRGIDALRGLLMTRPEVADKLREKAREGLRGSPAPAKKRVVRRKRS